MFFSIIVTKAVRDGWDDSLTVCGGSMNCDI